MEKPGGRSKQLPAVKVRLKDAQRTLLALKAAGAIAAGYKPEARGGWFYLPVKTPLGGYELCRHKFELYPPKGASSLKEILAAKLGSGPLAALPRAYDVIGDIAVIRVPPGLKAREGLVGRALLEANPRLKVVAALSAVAGKYRVRHIKVIAGEKRTHTVYRENGCTYQVDLDKAYFSTRLASERKRITGLVKPSEKVLVLYAGVGPFVIPVARKIKAAKGTGRVAGVEWNPSACRLMQLNAQTNQVDGFVQVLKGDAAKLAGGPLLRGWADRVVMPLLHQSIESMPLALEAAANPATIHAYGLVSTKSPGGLEEKKREIRFACRRLGRKCRILRAKCFGTYAPGVSQAVFDVRVEKITG